MINDKSCVHCSIIRMAAILAALSLVFRQSLSVGPDSMGRPHLDRNSGHAETRDWQRTHPLPTPLCSWHHLEHSILRRK